MVSVGHWFASRLQGGWLGNINGGITSHVLFTLKHYEGVATVWLLFLVALLIGMCVPNDPNLPYMSAEVQETSEWSIG